jgi:hypothetical protein
MIAFVILKKMAAFAVTLHKHPGWGGKLLSSFLSVDTWATFFPEHVTSHKCFCLNQEKVGVLLKGKWDLCYRNSCESF